MAKSEAEMTSIGITNAKWGVCGFASSLYAMFDLNPGVRGQVINATQGYRMLAEIKSFLRFLQADNSPLLKEILDFTRTFGKPFDTFDFDDYINRITEAAAKNLTVAKVLAEPLYSIALTPDAVADYVSRMWGWKGKVNTFAGGNGSGSGIIGVRSSTTVTSTGAAKPYNGLEHWMYRQGSVYSWGQKFADVAAAAKSGANNAPWTVCYVIEVTKG